MKKSILVPILILIIINTFTWSKSLGLNFYNDDFQNLGYLGKHFVGNPLSVFISKDVSIHYFRPIPNFLNTITLSIFGFNPLPFRILNLAFYLALITTIFIFILKISNSSLAAFVSALLFSLLPSHDIFLAWLASSGDVLSTIFLLLSFYFLLDTDSPKIPILSLLFFLLALLSKENSLLAPLLAFSLIFIFPEKRIRLLYFSLFSIFLIILLFSYRYFWLEINIFTSPNIENISLSQLLTNFFLYPFVIVVPTFAYTPENPFPILLNFIFVLIFATLGIIYVFRNATKSTKMIILGLLWYLWFVAPALPLFMRWYSLLPSVGLVVIFAELIPQVKRKFLWLLVLPLSTILLVVNYYSMSGWSKANKISENIIKASMSIEPNQGGKVLLWFFPEYFNNYPILRSGTQQAINFVRNVEFTEILLPIAIVTTPKTNVSLIESDSTFYRFNLKNAKPYLFHKSEKVEKFKSTKNDYYSLEIYRKSEYNYIITIRFLWYKPAYKNYYFDGNNFFKFF